MKTSISLKLSSSELLGSYQHIVCNLRYIGEPLPNNTISDLGDECTEWKVCYTG